MMITLNVVFFVTGKNVRSCRDEDPALFSMNPDPDLAQLEKYSGSDSGSDLKSKPSFYA